MITGWFLIGGSFDEGIQNFLNHANIPGVTLSAVKIRQVSYLVESGLPARLWYQGKPVEAPDFFFPIEGDEELCDLARQLEKLGSFCYNSIEAKRTAISKLATYQALAAAGVPTIKTMVYNPSISLETLVERIGLPCVIKPDDGFGGEGVMLAHDRAELAACLETLRESPSPVLVQEYIATSKGRDVRVMTISHRAVAAISRTASREEEFRSNVKVGGRDALYELTDEIRSISERTSRAVGLDLAGIDLLFGADGFVVGEVNSVPGFPAFLDQYNIKGLLAKDMMAKLMRHPYPRWRTDALLEQAAETPLPGLLLGLDDLSLFKAHRALLGRCQQVQERVLTEIVQLCASTRWGREHGFANIRSLEEFRASQPLTDWEDYIPYAERMQVGGEDELFPGKTAFFYRTSGTTSDFKYIPESRADQVSRGLITRLRNMELMSKLPKGVAPKVLMFTNPSRVEKTPGGIPVGTASGHLGEMLSPEVLQMMAYPPQLVNHFSGEALSYMMLRCALGCEELTGILGNNALSFTRLVRFSQQHAAELSEDIRSGNCRYPVPEELQEALAPCLAPKPARGEALAALAASGNFTPVHYWPQLKLAGFWLGGSLGAHVAEARKLLPADIAYMDVGYGASEIKINVPMRPGTPAGALAIACGFFEFIPEEGGEPLLAHELTDGARYELVVTTYSGLYRYRMHDLVQVEGFTGTTPNIYFVAKLQDIANLSQEKIPGTLLAECIRTAFREHGLNFVGAQLFPDPETMRYRICAEWEGAETDVETLAGHLEKVLCRDSANYAFRRTSGLLGPISLHPMRRGWSEALLERYARGQASLVQVKIPVVIDSLPDHEWHIK